MSADLAPIAGKLGNLVRLLASDKDGEVVAAARALGRTLKAHHSDFHALAACVEHANGKLKRSRDAKLYDAGYDAGIAAAASRNVAGDFRDLDGGVSWEAMAAHCRRSHDRLSMREREFINGVSARIVWSEPTEKPAKWLRSIFLRTGGRL